jgi:hypothetical protein
VRALKRLSREEARSVAAVMPPTRRLRFVLGQILRPCVLGYASLGLAVLLWGLTYKLSRYDLQHLNAPSRIPAAKLWIQHRYPSVTTSPPSTKIKLIPEARPFQVPSQQQVSQERAEWLAWPLEPQAVATSGSLIPFRSPPSHSFWLI